MKGTRKRQSASKTREEMLAQGVGLLLGNGLQPSLDKLTIDGCLEHLDIARSSAYNAWSEPDGDVMPQRRYQRAVLKRFVTQLPEDRGGSAFELATKLVEADDSIATREDLRRELNRLGAAEHFKKVTRDRGVRVRTALMFAATTANDDEVDQEMLDWFGEADAARRNELIETAVRPLVKRCGLRPKTALDGPEFWDQLSVAMASFGNGLFPHSLLSSNVNLGSIPVTGPDGVVRVWTLLGLVLDAIVGAFFEVDPDADIGLPSETDAA